jgi:hypothetical protein
MRCEPERALVRGREPVPRTGCEALQLAHAPRQPALTRREFTVGWHSASGWCRLPLDGGDAALGRVQVRAVEERDLAYRHVRRGMAREFLAEAQTWRDDCVMPMSGVLYRHLYG